MRWWSLGEFGSEAQALDALRTLRTQGQWTLELFSPYPVEGAGELLQLRASWVRWAALAGGIVGGGAAYAVQWWMNAWNWPLDVGGRPPHSWPAFVLLTYEGVILAAALGILVALLAAWRLPDLHHAALGAAGFASATGDRFWVGVEVLSEVERDAALAILRGAGGARVQAVEEVAR